MTPAEIPHRIGQFAAAQLTRLERLLPSHGDGRVDWQGYDFCTATAPRLPTLAFDFEPDAGEISRLLDGEWCALGFDWRWRDSGGAAWHVAPDTGTCWPLRFSGSIPYRAGNQYGDARVVWEPARLQALVHLALLVPNEPRACPMLERVLADWVRGNPYATGIHYVSTMECALRLIAVCHALDMTRSWLANRAATWSAFLRLAGTHARLIARRLSRYSSAGNHSIAEGVGLLYAAVVLREHPQAARWLALGLDLLESEAPRQVLLDGGGIEQAFGYQLFIIDLLGLAQALLAHAEMHVPAGIGAAVVRGRRFLRAFAREPGGVPPIGDGDGGHALSPYLRLSFAECADAGTPGPAARRFDYAGYTTCVAADARLTVVMDHGPLGMPPGYGHGHADALSVWAEAAGAPLLIDPGTYGYNLGAHWRRYFRSTRAHNTVVVDGRDQARQAGAFLWSAAYAVRLLRWEEPGGDVIVRIAACHDGYRDVGVVHERTLTVFRSGLLVVEDRLTGEGVHELELNWHLGVEPAGLSSETGELLLPGGFRLRTVGGECTLHTGEREPLLGWRSPRYGTLLPATVASTRWHGPLPHRFVTCLWPDGVSVDVETLQQ